MNLFFGITVAPYSVDFCNSLHEELHCRMFHILRPPFEMAFDVEAAERRCHFPLDRYEKRLGLRPFLLLYRLVKEEKPEWVFVPEFSLTALRMLLIRKLLHRRFRIISVCDDSLDMIRGNDFSRLHRLARCFVPRWVDDLVLANPDARKWYRDHFGKGLYMPIVSDEQRLREEFGKALGRAQELHRAFALQQRPVILYVGRLIPLKNLELMLESCRGIDATVVFVGDGPLKEKLGEQARSLGISALFVGRKDGLELAAWYDLADVVVLPSLQEAFGAVTGEALSAGCPVVVSSRAGSSFLVTEGRNGSVVDPGDPAALAAALRLWTGRAHGTGTMELRENLLPVRFKRLFEQLKEELDHV